MSSRGRMQTARPSASPSARPAARPSARPAVCGPALPSEGWRVYCSADMSLVLLRSSCRLASLGSGGSCRSPRCQRSISGSHQYFGAGTLSATHPNHWAAIAVWNSSPPCFALRETATFAPSNRKMSRAGFRRMRGATLSAVETRQPLLANRRRPIGPSGPAPAASPPLSCEQPRAPSCHPPDRGPALPPDSRPTDHRSACTAFSAWMLPTELFQTVAKQLDVYRRCLRSWLSCLLCQQGRHGSWQQLRLLELPRPRLARSALACSRQLRHGPFLVFRVFPTAAPDAPKAMPWRSQRRCAKRWGAAPAA